MPNTSPALSSLLANRALCRDCIAAHTRLKPDAIDAAIIALSSTQKVESYHNGTCLECGHEALVFAVDQGPMS